MQLLLEPISFCLSFSFGFKQDRKHPIEREDLHFQRPISGSEGLSWFLGWTSLIQTQKTKVLHVEF